MQAIEIITAALQELNLPFIVKDGNRGDNPCGLYLEDADHHRIQDFIFDKVSGEASFNAPEDRQCCGTYADHVLQALTKANQAFARLETNHWLPRST